ncbi:adenine-specific methyltransferase EcoRI family protein [Campylobacter sp. LR264d]|uniref:adenine-specific methyltransferase EcoRI family protein n=1 Tax=Campylobacter sp. LR264d TaxID=2593544 RepID=UPI001CC21CBD|nr:adenine-specific methyltransferase EcoRI family protein [Campylobacter sp. LR264d]
MKVIFFAYFMINFKRLGIKELIATSYNASGRGTMANISINKKHLSKLKSDGDFRSKEVVKLGNKADFIIRNLPFSLFREFIKWCDESDKKFAIIGNLNAISTKDIFLFFQQNKLWLGASINSGDRKFLVPNDYDLNAIGCGVNKDGNKYIKVKGVMWFTNIESKKKNEFLSLNTMADNLNNDKKLIKKNAYKQYDNIKAIEIPTTKAIPSDYNGVMGVPISFLDKYNPKQFKIIGIDFQVKDGFLNELKVNKWQGKLDRAYLNGKRLYSRIFTKKENLL